MAESRAAGEQAASGTPPSPTTSVLIVTRDRAGQLRRCLESLRTQSSPPFEVIVVDNGSSDETSDVIRSYEERLPVRYLFEPAPSIPRARNVALTQARGEVAVFIDDDCVADPAWLDEARRALAIHPHAVLVQGDVESRARSVLGLALAVNSEVYFARHYFCADGGLRYAWSANLMVNPAASPDPVRFDVRFRRSSDRELGARLVRQGHEVAYHPAMRVVHAYDGVTLGGLLVRFFRNARLRDRSVSGLSFLRAVRDSLADRGAVGMRAAGVIAATVLFLGAGAVGAAYAQLLRALGRAT